MFGEAELKRRHRDVVVVIETDKHPAENLQRLAEDLFNRYLRLPRLRLR